MGSLRYLDHAQHLALLIRAALAAADPAQAVRRHWSADDLRGVDRVFVVGAGKASVAMATAAMELIGARLHAGVIAAPQPPPSPCPAFQFIAAGHPKPDAGSLRAGEAIADLLTQASERDLVIVLISGGGSALLERPVPGLSLDDLQALTDHLLRSGAPIEELNCVRKHLSQIKGGGLAKMIIPARAIALILSDVIDDPLDVIASGPTVPDPTTVAQAQSILARRGASRRFIPLLHETPKPGDPLFARITNRLIGSNALALRAVADAARELGFRIEIAPEPVRGEARDYGDRLARSLRARPPDETAVALIAGGETTVTVRGRGRGGRNQELALAAAMGLDGTEKLCVVASLGTDGVDGPTPAAGAIARPDTVKRAQALGLDAAAMLENNDAYPFFSALGDCILTGATGTNVNDVVLALVYPE